MKKMFKIHITKEDKNELFTIEPIEECKGLYTINVGLNEEFKLGDVYYKVIKLGNTYKLKLLFNDEMVRIYNRITIVLPITPNETTGNKTMIGIRPPANRLESILTNFKIGYKSLKYVQSDIKVMNKYEIKLTDGETSDFGNGYIAFSRFNWVVLGNKSNNKVIFEKIVVKESISNNTDSLNSLESKLATLRFYDHYSDVPPDEIKPTFEKMLTNYFKIPKSELNDVLTYNDQPIELNMSAITTDTLITDGLLYSDPSYKCSDYKYIIQYARSLRTNLKHKLAKIYINPNKLNVGLIYLIQTILSKEAAVVLYDEEKDRNYIL